MYFQPKVPLKYELRIQTFSYKISKYLMPMYPFSEILREYAPTKRGINQEKGRHEIQKIEDATEEKEEGHSWMAVKEDPCPVDRSAPGQESKPKRRRRTDSWRKVSRKRRRDTQLASGGM